MKICWQSLLFIHVWVVELTCVVPLGFHAVAPLDGHASLSMTGDMTADFDLGCVAATGSARGMGYWKHQAKVYVKGKGNAQETEADMATLRALGYERPFRTVEDGVPRYMDWLQARGYLQP